MKRIKAKKISFYKKLKNNLNFEMIQIVSKLRFGNMETIYFLKNENSYCYNVLIEYYNNGNCSIKEKQLNYNYEFSYNDICEWVKLCYNLNFNFIKFRNNTELKSKDGKTIIKFMKEW